jgi:uncharacterized Rmd1/YagE family protein
MDILKILSINLNKNKLFLLVNKNEFRIVNRGFHLIKSKFYLNNNSNNSVTGNVKRRNLVNTTQAIADASSSNKLSDASLSTAITPRIIKKKPKKSNVVLSSSMSVFKVKAYATADYYDLNAIQKSLINSGAYEIIDLDKLLPYTCLYVKAKYQEINEIEPRHIIFFEDGSVVFWNVSVEEQNNILEMLKKHDEKQHPSEFIDEESEVMDYSRVHPNDTAGKAAALNNHEPTSSSTGSAKHRLNVDLRTSRFIHDHIYFLDYSKKDSANKANEYRHLLEKYAFSDAIALSVKLGIWERLVKYFFKSHIRTSEISLSIYGDL